MARTIASGTPHQDTVATTHTTSAPVTKDIERFDATSAPVTATLPTAVGIVGRSFTIIKVDSTTNAVNIATTSSQTITGTGGTTDAIISQGAATTYTSDGANWVTSSTAGIPFTDPGSDKVLYFQNSTKAVKPVTIGTNLTFSSGTLDASGGGGLTVGTTSITSGASSRLLYETSGHVVGELILGTNLSISGGTTLDAAGGSPTNISTRSTNSTAQTFTRNAITLMQFDTDTYDTDTSHYTSDAALTGTVATNGTTAITGTSTAFTTELSVGQVFGIPDGMGSGLTAYCVVTAITNNTSLTVATQTKPSATVSGKTGTRTSAAFVARTAGTYSMFGHLSLSAESQVGAYSGLLASYNGDANGAPGNSIEFSTSASSIASALLTAKVATAYAFNQWDYVLVGGYAQTAVSGDLTATATVLPHFEFQKMF